MLRNISSTVCYKNCISRSWLAYGRRQLSSQGVLVDDQPQNVAEIANMRDSIQEKLKAIMHHQQQQQQSLLRGSSKTISIYRVPEKLRDVDPKAYIPQVISIGPYHYGSAKLMAFEGLKWESLSRVVGSSGSYKDELDRLLSVLDSIEPKARECYSEDVVFSRDKFVEMMLLDGCFIVELLKELERNKYSSLLPKRYSSLLPKRWMLPVVRCDLVALENQLPMMVLKKIFEETMKSNSTGLSLEGLALNFFDPLMPRKSFLRRQSIESITDGSRNFHHLLDVFHSSITPGKNVTRGQEPHMYRPLSELKKAGIKVRLLSDKQPLEMRFERGVLRMPTFVLDNHTGSFLKNLMAYEQCHSECDPDVTTYMFFLDKLVNSGEDIAMLHYEGVLQHSLGSNKQASVLISELCKDVEHDGKESYLHGLVAELNSHSGKPLVKIMSRLKQEYFKNTWVSLSTLAALLLLYLTLLQATCDALESQKKRLHHQSKGLWASIHIFLLNPYDICKNVANNFVERLMNTEEDPDDHQIENNM